MKIIIRTDASLIIGCGHVYRCLTLADQLTRLGCEVEFIAGEVAGNLNELITEKGYVLHSLPVIAAQQLGSPILGRTWQQDALLTEQILAQAGADWLVVDHYSLDNHWHKVVTVKAGNSYQLMVIDDLVDRVYDCDRLLDQTFERQASDYLIDANLPAELLLGTDFCLLRDEFSKYAEQAKVNRLQYQGIKTILLSLGGTDIDNITTTVLKLLDVSPLADSTQVNVIIGPNNPHAEKLKKVICEARLQCRLFIAVNDIARYMTQADVAIGAAGSSAWERCALSLPALNIILADNQRTIAKRLDAQGVAISLGEPESLTAESIVAALAKCDANYQQMSNAASQLVDGMGASRVALSMFSAKDSLGHVIYLKRASHSDCQSLYDWQQSLETRRYALNSATPTWQEHSAWFANKIAQADSYLLMLRRNSIDVGMVRLDPLSEPHHYLISIVTAPECYRQGIAKAAVMLIRQAFKLITIHATVLADNHASQALFRNTGYTQLTEEQWIQYPAKDTNE
ncbi:MULTISPECIES: UDP-2,4-diacetamido-2,4,6-trideoxy-beta-L-altropyranose hydrolase [unclassified Shewanella]|uniref:UDP-2,4-diacetamido-2,4, 6-trideoxy-beta-L-altropyranose hydrolase n=1 Tax=unclassified Shewanella TaxID=196818 RepID=UPI001BC375FC|nr:MULTISPECIES: UDP-2,4-diacetamido-2,4,6-trideoxy-beta-L-altropyranose hydrolase [unclassified Shewanella]GIU14653.1 UDP-2,4-diacetamido-2,4,6-trideoxy-beta-L-altropyranose hydrolase [Shewanella sp. MBTL60-112-B1]GIU37810.1 UDP-2,4-diacetamido-2,4,6-trideoxy-beta-L-altropyranose hydrolase [Shewanella sp. MBTL60-112-B2]